MEIIVVNDGSIDNTGEIVSSYGNKVRYFAKANGGVASALNFGIKNMKGDYFSWLSHDDLYLPNKIERQIEELSMLEDKDTMLFSNWIAINSERKEITRTFFDGYPDDKLSNPLFCVLFGLIHGCTTLISKRNFSLCGLFDETLETTQDYDLWFRIASRISIKFMKDYLVKVRVHAEQKTRADPESNVESNAIWINAIQRLSPDDILSMERSKFTFLIKMRRFLRRAKYFDAAEVVEKIMKQHLDRRIVSILLLGDDCKRLIYKIFLRPLLKLIFGKDFVKRKIDRLCI
jgi:glycosyltransferase involved in cell wall biosynthesis